MKTSDEYCDCSAADNGVGVQHEEHCASRVAACVLYDARIEIDDLFTKLVAARVETARLRQELTLLRRGAPEETP